MNPLELIRPHLRNFQGYSSARDECQALAETYLDANENPFEQDYNRYPGGQIPKLKSRISDLWKVPLSNIFLGCGSDEAIDLIIKAFCSPGKDKIMVLPPTYGMYSVSARIQDVEVVEVPLSDEFQPEVAKILANCEGVKVLFLCSPNNPTGNVLNPVLVNQILNQFPGIVVVDEAYAEFSNQKNWLLSRADFPNLIVLRTLSKAWGGAGIRLGMAVADEKIIRLLDAIKPPYNLGSPAIEAALRLLKNPEKQKNEVNLIKAERENLIQTLVDLPAIEKVYPSETNFLLCKVNSADQLYDFLISRGIVVRNRSKLKGCENCLRITVGTPTENQTLIQSIKASKHGKSNKKAGLIPR